MVGVDAGLRKSEDATHLATDGPAPRRQDGYTTAARVRVAVFVRSEKSNALVGDGVLQPAPRSANLDSASWGLDGPPGATGVLLGGVPPVKGVWGAALGSPPQAPIFGGFFD